MPDGHHIPLGGLLHPQLGRMSVLSVGRHAFIVVTLLAVWLTLAPYTSLRPEDYEPTGAGPINYVVFGLMAAVAMMLLLQDRLAALASAATPAMIALWVWLAANAVLSTSPSASLTRLALVAFAFLLAASVPLLAQSEEAFNRCLAAAAWMLLGLCYFGVIAMPSVSIHSHLDIVEPHLAGDWRGTFAHKNSAAPVMAMLVFVGVHLIRSGGWLNGALMAAFAGNFLLFSGGKTATSMCLFVLLAGTLMTRLGSFRALALAAFVPLALINLVSVGSVMFPALDSLLEVLPIDASFTGRADIWSFVLDAIRMRPILGYGFAAFWGEPVSANLQIDSDTAWAAGAAHSHNGYLDLAVTLGLPGLLLCLVVFLYKPLKDFAQARRIDPANSLAVLFLQIWLFNIYLASMEPVFLYRIDPGWFTYLVAIFGLHYLARFPLRHEGAADRG